MAQPHQHQGETFDSEHLRRYLPAELAAAIADNPSADGLDSYTVEAFVHLAAARYTVATYLPRLLTRQLLDERLATPWLRWTDGSLLFADLSGSTALAERLGSLGREGSEVVTEFLNHIFDAMIQVIQEYGGDLIAFGGDALLVFFGDERHARTAARAALALQAALHGYERAVPGVGVFPMHLHIGVESGMVGFASAGLAHARHFCVVGAAVNRVVLAEAHAGPGKVVAGPHATAALAGYGEGAEIAPGLLRISAMRPPTRPHEPLPDASPATLAPKQAIPQLLDDLHRISAYISPALLERILAEPQRPQIEADLRPVSVLFAQVLGLEALAEALPPERAAQAIQAYVATMQEAVELFGGVVNKLDVADEGIRLVAIVGAPTAYEDHAERAALAALEMQERLALVNAQISRLLAEHEEPTTEDQGADPLNDPSLVLRPSPFIDLQQRIGLNLGTAFAGNVGSPVRKEYTVMGDAVNVAARVMSTAAWGEIWCSDATARSIGERMLCEPRGEVAVKGKAAPLALLRVAGRRESQPETLHAQDGPLIGRAAELAWLSERLDAARHGGGRAVRIAGDAGVGKTRLLAALLDAARGMGARVVPAACFSYTAGIPYAAWAEWLKSLCGIVSGDGNAQRIDKLAATLATLGPGMEEWLPVLGDLARLDVPDNRLTRGLDAKMRQTRRFELLLQLLLRAADDGPLLVLFEDLHWADPISLELWRHVVPRLAGRPILLVGVHRPSQSTDGDGAEVLELRELSPQESGAMVSALNGARELPEPMLNHLVARAGGNPLFLSELFRAVHDKLQIADLRWQQDNTGQSTIYNLQTAIDELPDSLNGLLLSRIDRLDEISRGVLRVASVIGQRIPFGVLRSLHSTDQDTLVRQMSRLDTYEMTQLERVEPERVHIFRHALIQEVAYQSMLYARRRDLHGRIGAYLERRYADDLDDYYGLLAHHYRLSDRRDKAVEFLLMAGRAAHDVYANDEAIQYYCWALEALGEAADDPRLCEAHDALGEVYATVGRYDEALEQHTAILETPGAGQDARRRAHRKRGSVLEKQGQYAQALDELGAAMAIARSGDPGISPLAIPLISADIGLVFKRQGDYDQAIAACEEGLSGLRRDPRTREDEQIEARLHSELGGIYGMRGDYPRARQHFEHSLRIRELIDDLPGLTAAHNNLGYLWQLQSAYERAIEHYAVAEEIARKINLRFMLVFADLNTAYALTSLGRYGEARTRCDEALALSQEMNDRRNVAQAYDTLGLILYHQGEYEPALAAYQEELAIHQSLGSAYQEGSTLANMAAALSAQGQYAAALESATRALEWAETLRGERLKVEALSAQAEALLGLGDVGRAADVAFEAAQVAEAIASTFDLGVAKRSLGRARAEHGGNFAASFAESMALFAAIHDRFELGRTQAAYGQALLRHGRELDGRAYLKQAQDTFMALGANGELQRLAPL